MSLSGRARSRVLVVASLTLSACFPATPVSGFDVDTGSASCQVTDSGDEAVLSVPLTPSAFDRISLYGVSLRGGKGMQIDGILIMPQERSSPAPSLTDVSERLRAAGTRTSPATIYPVR